MFIKKKELEHFLNEYLKIHKEDGYVISDIPHLAEFLERKLWHLLVEHKANDIDEELEMIADKIIENIRKAK